MARSARTQIVFAAAKNESEMIVRENAVAFGPSGNPWHIDLSIHIYTV